MSTKPIYFGGDSARDGKVRRLPCKGFTELLERWIKGGSAYPFTRAEFAEMTTEEKNARKDTAFISCAHYPYELDGKRNDENADGMTGIVLDLDEGDEVRDLFESPEVLIDHLAPFNFVAWVTAKHTAASPRMKVFIPTDGVLPKECHKPGVKFAADRIGLSKNWKGRKESQVLTQPQYLPPVFKDEKLSSILVTVTDGQLLKESDIPTADEPDEIVYADGEVPDLDLISLAYQPIPDFTVEDAREPLFKIDSDCSYQEWTEIIRALRHQFSGDEEDSRQAFELLDEWSSQGSKYRGSDATYRKWKSFSAYPKGRAPITIKTFFKLAEELGGWDNGPVVRKLKEGFQEWLETCEDPDTLAAEGTKRIAASPFPSAVMEETMLHLLRDRLKVVSGRSFTLKSLEKDVAKHRKRDREEKIADKTPQWLQDMVFVAEEGVIMDVATGSSLPVANFNLKYAEKLMPEPGKGDMPANMRPVAQPSDYALNIVKIPRVDASMFNPARWSKEAAKADPSDPSSVVGSRIFKWRGKEYVNTFNPSSITAGNSKHAERAMKLFRQMVSKFAAEPEHVEHIINFVAHIRQNPGKKILHALLIQSVQGTGKSTFSKVLRAVFGGQNVATLNPAIVASTWNDWAVNNGFLNILEEMHTAGSNRRSTMDGLKSLITDPLVAVNKRNTTAFSGLNFANYIAFTNRRDSILLEPGDRRWWVCNSPYQTRDQILELNASGHFDEIQWLLTKDGAGGLSFGLQNHNIPDSFDPNGPAPRTRYAEEIIEASEPRDQREVREYIKNNPAQWVRQGEYVDENALFGMGSRVRHNLRELGYEQVRESPLFVHRDWQGDRDDLLTEWAMSGEFEV